MEGNRKTESGQAIVLLAISLIVLLGFTALAIDGGMIYSDRRQAQNASDAAAMAGALQRANNQNNTQIKLAATNSATANGYDSGQMSVSITPFTDFSGTYTLVTVVITSTPSTSFMQLLYGGEVKNVVSATARVRMSQPAMPGMAIMAMGNCVEGGGPLINGNGGGHDGGFRTYEGGIFVNAPESGSDPCAIDPGRSSDGYGVDSGEPIYSVGSYNYSGEENISPLPVQTGINGGTPVGDPLEGVPEPSCGTTNGSIVGGVHQPGRYGGGGGQPAITSGEYAPGIYCISGDVHLSANEYISGDGVVLYFRNGRLVYSGNNSYLRISAPDSSNCLGSVGPATSSCTYAGIAIFSSRSNTNIIDVRGNSSNAVNGMIYALNGEVRASGGGNTPEEAVVFGQVICRQLTMNGNGDIQVTYDGGRTYNRPTEISLHK